MKKLLLSGNEAVALGAYSASAKVGVGYPGTPSTEILENFCKYKNVYAEWSVNEKVALEVGLGASIAGIRTIVTMKHVGVNVAADPLFTSSYIGTTGGLVVVAADDPSMHSSQNEQDSRYYAIAAKIPMLEPSDSDEAYQFTKLAFELSEKYGVPIFVRITTRIAHSKSIVNHDEVAPKEIELVGFKKNPKKYVMIPAFAKERHKVLEETLLKLSEDVNNLPINRKELNKDIGVISEKGFITSGVCYNYVKEVFQDIPILKLGMVNPLPKNLILDFCKQYETVYIVEELDPIFETYIKALGIKNIIGKEIFPILGELNSSIIRDKINGIKSNSEIKSSVLLSDIKIPPRPPTLCPGCPHRQIFAVLSKLGCIVSGDIGCYTLGVLPPFNAMDTCIDMGASITVAEGLNLNPKNSGKIVSVIGDSTFAHSGITGLVNAAYNKHQILIIVLDNGTTAMTGMQPNPLSGETINREPTIQIDYELLAASVGIKPTNFRIIDAYNQESYGQNSSMEEVVKEMLESKKLSLLVIKGLCVILKKKVKGNNS